MTVVFDSWYVGVLLPYPFSGAACTTGTDATFCISRGTGITSSEEPSRTSSTGCSFLGSSTVLSPSVPSPLLCSPSTTLGEAASTSPRVGVDSISDGFSSSMLSTPDALYTDGSVSPSSSSFFYLRACIFPNSIELMRAPSWYISPFLVASSPSSSANLVLTIFRNFGANCLASLDL